MVSVSAFPSVSELDTVVNKDCAFETGIPNNTLSGSAVSASAFPSVACGQIHLTRHVSHEFSHTIKCAYHTAWLKTSHPMCLCSAHSYHLHAIHDVCLIVSWLRPRSVLLLFLSVVYFFSSLSYLYSDQQFLSNVNSVEGINHCAFAQRGVLLHGDIPSSHTL